MMKPLIRKMLATLTPDDVAQFLHWLDGHTDPRTRFATQVAEVLMEGRPDAE
jgi:hypothetical protein